MFFLFFLFLLSFITFPFYVPTSFHHIIPFPDLWFASHCIASCFSLYELASYFSSSFYCHSILLIHCLSILFPSHIYALQWIAFIHPSHFPLNPSSSFTYFFNFLGILTFNIFHFIFSWGTWCSPLLSTLLLYLPTHITLVPSKIHCQFFVESFSTFCQTFTVKMATAVFIEVLEKLQQ